MCQKREVARRKKGKGIAGHDGFPGYARNAKVKFLKEETGQEALIAAL
jgi:hypothetical protein